MRLIDADELKEHAWRDKLDSRELIAEMIDNAPTVKEISTNIPISIFERLISQEPCSNCCNGNQIEKAKLCQKSYLAGMEHKPKIGHCKDCKHFEYDSVVKVDGIPLIMAHEICSKWGDGCKTSENGYCFLFEPKMQEVEDDKDN